MKSKVLSFGMRIRLSVLADKSRHVAKSTLSTVTSMLLLGGLGSAPGLAWAVGPIVTLPPPGQIVNIESDVQYDDINTPGGAVVYARTTPNEAGAGYGWWLRLDLRVKNTSAAPISVVRVTVDTDETNPENVPLEAPVPINPGQTRTILVPGGFGETDDNGPTTLSVAAYLQGYARPLLATAPLVEHEAPTVSGGYAFPARSNDLPAGVYWSVGAHTHTESQRYAYDFGARRWDAAADKWTPYTAAAVKTAANGGPALGTSNDQWLIWKRPVYALADATIVRCARSIPDNVPGQSIGGGGNFVTLDMGDGTYVTYYHLRRYTVPAALCPIEGGGVTPLSIPLSKGTQIGEVGNSGHSGESHLHLQHTDSPISTTAGHRGLPLRFTTIRVHGSAGYNPETDASGWYVVGPGESGVPVHALIKPPCVGPSCAIAQGG